MSGKPKGHFHSFQDCRQQQSPRFMSRGPPAFRRAQGPGASPQWLQLRIHNGTSSASPAPSPALLEARTPLTTGTSPCRKCQCPSQGQPRPTHSGVTPGNTRAGVPRAPSPAHCCQGRPPQHSRVLAGHCALITSEQLLSWMLRCSGPREPPDTELQRKPNLMLLHSPSKSNCFGN